MLLNMAAAVQPFDTETYHCVGLPSLLSPSTHADCPWAVGWTHLLPCIRFSPYQCHRDARSGTQWCQNMKLRNHRHIMYTLCCVISDIYSYFSHSTNNCLYYFLYFSRYFLLAFAVLYRQIISPIRTVFFFPTFFFWDKSYSFPITLSNMGEVKHWFSN